MATIGQSLTTPESGWRRYDEKDSRIGYSVNYGSWADSTAYGSTLQAYSDTVNFTFYGTKLRIIGFRITTESQGPGYTGNTSVIIDGDVVGTINESASTSVKMCLEFSIDNLELKYHKVVLKVNDAPHVLVLDAIDIDDTGYLLHPVLNQKTKIEDMEIGDCIPCRYYALTSGTAGLFSHLGTWPSNNEIPLLGSATPNGLFYFIKVDKGLLIADRAVQHSISWNALNSARYIEGKYSNTTSMYAGITNNVLLNSVNYTSNFTLASSTSLSVTGRSTTAGNGQWNRSLPITNNVSSFYLKFKLKQIANGVEFYLHHNNATTNNIVYISISRTSISSPGRVAYTGDTLNKDIILYGNKETGEFFCKVDGVLVYQGSIYYSGGSWGNPLFQQVYTTTSTTNATTEFEYYYLNLYLNGTSTIQFVNNDLLIRSLSGGNAYLGADGLPKLTNEFLGTWPTTNEYYKYIMYADLNGKITPHDDKIWNVSKLYSMCKDTPISGVWIDGMGHSASATNTKRTMLGYTTRGAWVGENWTEVTNSYTDSGFRPVLEYPDNENSKNVWY